MPLTPTLTPTPPPPLTPPLTQTTPPPHHFLTQGTEYSYLVHTTDWLPSILGGMLGQTEVLTSAGSQAQTSATGLDGVDQWSAILLGSEDNEDALFSSSSMLSSSTLSDSSFSSLLRRSSSSSTSASTSSSFPSSSLSSSSSSSYSAAAPRQELLLQVDYLDVLSANFTGYDTAAIIIGDYKLVTNEVCLFFLWVCRFYFCRILLLFLSASF